MPSELPPAPTSVIDAAGRPRFGTYAGAVHTVDLGRLAGPLGRLRRHKTWQFALIATDEDLVSALNAGEDAIWAGQTLQPLPPVRFLFDRTDVLSPWRIVAGDALDLTVVPTACHREERNLGVAKSRFVQAAGEASGTVVVGGRTLRLDRVAAVVEDQSVRW